MSYTVWVMVEDDMGQGGEGRTYWSVDHHDTEEEAIAHAEDICSQEYARTGVEPQRVESEVDGWAEYIDGKRLGGSY